MKISPLAAGGTPFVNPSEGSSASPERIARAKAISAGQTPEAQAPVTDPQVARAQESIKRIRLRTKAGPDRFTQSLNSDAMVAPADPKLAELAELAPEGAVADPVDDSLVPNEQVESVKEDTKPISPQLAAIARQKRMLQLKEQELVAKEKALTTQPAGQTLEEYKARIKANALSVLQEEGVTYDQLTEQILATNQENAKISALETKIASLEKGLQDQGRSQTEKDAQTEKQVLAQLTRDATSLVSEGDAYEMVREAGYAPKVVELIHKVYKKTGELMDTAEAANLVEAELLEEALQFAKLKKVQSRLNQAAPAQTKPAAAPQAGEPKKQTMRTLTNRDGSTSLSLDRRQRAIAAMEGRLK